MVPEGFRHRSPIAFLIKRTSSELRTLTEMESPILSQHNPALVLSLFSWETGTDRFRLSRTLTVIGNIQVVLRLVTSIATADQTLPSQLMIPTWRWGSR